MLGLWDDSRKFLLKKMPKHSVCAEIGVYKGDFSQKILKIVRPKVLHLIDPWKFEPDPIYRDSLYGGAGGVGQEHMDSIYKSVQERFRNEIESGRVVIHRATSASAALEFKDGYFEWIYIDGNHQYEFAKKDLESFCPKVREKGYLTGDDYAPGGWWEGGVQKAVDEFVGRGLCHVTQIRNCQFILQKRREGVE